MSSVRSIAAVSAVVLLGVAPAPPVSSRPAVGKPVTVVVRRDGGFSPHPRVYWYGRDGVAYLDGALAEGRRGSFRARVDYTRVERVVADAALCSPEAAKPAPIVKPERRAMDLIVYRVSVRCGDVWRQYRTTEIPEQGAARRVHDALRELDALVPTLTWTATQDDLTPPDGGALH